MFGIQRILFLKTYFSGGQNISGFYHLKHFICRNALPLFCVYIHIIIQQCNVQIYVFFPVQRN